MLSMIPEALVESAIDPRTRIRRSSGMDVASEIGSETAIRAGGQVCSHFEATIFGDDFRRR